jgi:hypothetical protein
MNRILFGCLLCLSAAASPIYRTYLTNTVVTLTEGQTFEILSGSNAGVNIANPDGTTIAVAYFFRFDQTPTNLRDGSGSIFAGPIKLLVGVSSADPNQAGYVSARLTPGIADAATTLIVPPTTNSVTLQLQSSTNLVDWSAAATVTLTNVPAALFIRAKLAN